MSLNEKVISLFPGKIVRKDLSKLIKEWQNVPIYVLEYLLGMYAATDDEEQIKEWVKRVKTILSDNYVRPDEAERVKARIKEDGTFTVIDKVTAKLDEKKDAYVAEFSNLWLKNVRISTDYVQGYEKLLAGWIWCTLQMWYFFDEEERKGFSPFIIEWLKPIQLANMDLNEVLSARKEFEKEEWIDFILRSTWMEPTHLENNVKWHLLERLVPLVENNYNLCELWPRGTGKSYVYKEISPNSILISWGQTTVANLFYNMSSRTIWLVWLRDVVAFDEVAWINFKDKDWIQIMKDYMNSWSFARGKEEKTATASIVFVWNIDQSVDVVLRTSNLFSPFPDAMNTDTAFFDRMHYYVPWWEVPKFNSSDFTNEYWFIVDYLAEFFREMRKVTYADWFNDYFRFWPSLSHRDSVAVKKTFSWLVKLIYPDGNFTKEQADEILQYAMQWRRRVKEQLKKIGGMEFYDVQFSYVDLENNEERYVSLPEMWWGKLIPEWHLKPGHLFFVENSDTWMKWVYKIETQMSSGNGKFQHSWLSSNAQAKENMKIAIDYFTANAKNISQSIKTKDANYHIHTQDMQWIWATAWVTLPGFIALCSSALDKPVQSQLVVLWWLTIWWTIKKVDNLADMLQVCLDAGAKKVLLPATSAQDIWTVPSDLFSKFQVLFYESAEDAVYKSMWVS